MLTGSYWRIDSLRGEPVEGAEGAREPHLLLTDEGRYAATVGCNQMAGGYELSGAATMMA